MIGWPPGGQPVRYGYVSWRWCNEATWRRCDKATWHRPVPSWLLGVSVWTSGRGGRSLCTTYFLPVHLGSKKPTRRASSAATHFLRSLLCGGFICSAGRPLLDEASGAYEKALELEPENQPARNSLQSLLKLAHDLNPIWVSLTNVHRFKLPAAS